MEYIIDDLYLFFLLFLICKNSDGNTNSHLGFTKFSKNWDK